LPAHEIARAFLREAQSDLNSARALYAAAEYARCIAHAHHTVQKSLKAVMAARGTIVTGRHQASSDFAACCADLSEVDRIGGIAGQLERMAGRAEDPIFADPTRPIWIPSEQFDQSDAQHALADAQFVFECLSEHLQG
jgi:HEPN domain-containing protein